MGEKKRQIESRLRTARAQEKARGIMAEVLADPEFPMTLLLAGNRDRTRWQIVPGGMLARHMTQALIVAADAVQRMAEHEEREGGKGEPVRIDVREQDEPRAGAALGKKRAPEVTVAPDGSLQAPDGETFTLCAECGASRWFATSRPDDFTIARMVCVGCGNELKLHAVPPGAQTAGTA